MKANILALYMCVLNQRHILFDHNMTKLFKKSRYIMKQIPILFLFALLLPLGAFAWSPSDSLDLEQYISQNELEVKDGGDGLYYTIEKEGKGESPKARDYVKIRYTGKLLNGKVFDQSKEGESFVFQLGYRIVIQGWEKGIPLFPVGSKGKLYVPPHLAYGKAGLGSIPSEAPLVYELEILEILDAQAYDNYMIEQEKKERKAYEAHVRNQFKRDKKLIHEYAADHKLRTKRTPSGMSYAITKKGKGATAKSGDQLAVHYEGFLLSDEKFDSSYDKKEPYRFTLGKRKVIKGWDEGLQYFNKGSEGWLLIPSKFAYGRMSIEEENVSIPADAVLIFKIKVIDIESPMANK